MTPRLAGSGRGRAGMQRIGNERMAQYRPYLESAPDRGDRRWRVEVMAQSLEGTAQPRPLFPPRSTAYLDDTGPRLLQGNVRRIDRSDQCEYGAFRIFGFFARFRKPKSVSDAGTPPARPVFDAGYESKVEEAKANLDRTAQALMRGRVVGLDNALLPDIARSRQESRNHE